MSRLKTGLKVSAWVAIFIVAVVYLQRYGIAPLQSAVNDMGIWAPLGLFLLRGVSIILPALPSSVYSLLAGSLLGFKAGYLTIILSDLVFCSAAFFIARRWGRGPVSRLVGASAMKRIDGFSKNQLEGNFFLMTGLLMTGLFDFLSYAIGISRTHWRLFAPPSGTADQRADQRFDPRGRRSRRRSGRQPHLGLGSAGHVCSGHHHRCAEKEILRGPPTPTPDRSPGG